MKQIARLFRGRWAYIAALLTAILLWLDLGAGPSLLAGADSADMLERLSKAFTGRGNLLSLPLLAALPFAANAYAEMRSGFTKFRIFRCGKRAYFACHALALICTTVFSQALGVMLFCLTVSVLSGTVCLISGPMLLQRVLAVCVFAFLGNIGAILTRDTVSAYVFPVAAGFSLSLLKTRFFPDASCFDPISWLSPERGMLLFLSLLSFGMLLLSTGVTVYGVKRYV